MLRGLAGALVGLFLFVAPAHAQIFNPQATQTLQITVIATTMKHPAEFEALRVSLPYPTSFTCDEARDWVDLKTVLTFAKKRLPDAITVRRATAACVPANPII